MFMRSVRRNALADLSLKSHVSLVLMLVMAGHASATLIQTQFDDSPTLSNYVDDGVISASEYPTAYMNGGGAGFGGTLGNATLHIDSDASSLYLGLQPGADLNDNVVIFLDTRGGGFGDPDMNDTADPARNLSSNLTRDVNDVFAFDADFSVVMGAFGIVVFELNAGNTPNHLNFISFENDQSGNSASLAREVALDLSTLGNPTMIDFFAAYGSDTNFMSNESLPLQNFNAGNNLGFDNDGTSNPVDHDNFNRFVIPEPGSLLLLWLGILATLGLARN